MDAALIQTKINYGYGKAATYLGGLCQWYRPTSTTFINESTLQGTLMAYFDPKSNFEAKVPSSFAHPEWFIAADRTNLQISDYLVDPLGNTYFVNCLESLTPTSGILTNAVATIFRPGADQAPGPNYYAGNPSGEGTSVLTNCPCAILQGTKGEADTSGLVAEGRQPWAAIWLPSITGVTVEIDDILIDNQGRRYELSSIETSILGVRITAAYAGT